MPVIVYDDHHGGIAAKHEGRLSHVIHIQCSNQTLDACIANVFEREIECGVCLKLR